MPGGAPGCFNRPRATSRLPVSKTSTRPSPKERELCPTRTASCLLSVWYEPQSASHRLQATCRFSRLPGRGRPWRPRSGAHTGKEVGGSVTTDEPAPEHWGRFETPHTDKGPQAEQGASTSYKPRATSHRLAQNELRSTGHPVTVTTHHEPNTTHQQGGPAGPPLRRDMTTHYRQQAACPCFVRLPLPRKAAIGWFSSLQSR